MRLRKKNEGVAGGWRYQYTDQFGNSYEVKGVSLRDLIQKTEKSMRINGLEVPKNLDAWIEDQLCTRQPAGKCTYDESLGDRITVGIHAAARVVDIAANAVGLKTELEKKARICIGCHRRRMKLHS